MTQATYTEVISSLSRAALPLRELHGSGHVAVTTAAGRIIALAFKRNGPNLLWSNPQLSDSALTKNQPEKLVGGLGGDRLWFAPELEYHWHGVPQWDTLTNYKVPTAADPGAYTFNDAADNTIALQGTGALQSTVNGHRVGFEITRTIRMPPSPLPANVALQHQIHYAGIETSHVLRFDSDTTLGRLDLWHLLQMPVGSVLIVPLKAGSSAATQPPLSYALSRGDWLQKPDKLLWRYGGTAGAKIGLSSRALTGRTAVLQALGTEEYCLIVRQFAVNENAPYADHPYGHPRTDQAFQAFDGMGFGEMEYHSPMLDAQSGPRELRESDQLWAFGGSQTAMSAIAEQLLQTDLTDAFTLLGADPCHS